MINLLPPEMVDEFVYARKNTNLLRWVIVFVLVIIAIFGIVIAGQLYIDRSIKSHQAQIEQIENQLKVQKLEETQKNIESISGNIKLAVQVLSRQLLFSSILRQIGSTMPEGSVLTGLSITKVEGGLDLTAAARDYNTATQVQVNLQDSANKLFEKSDIINVECKPAGTNSTNANTGESNATQLDLLYPCKITVRALFAKNNPFLLINSQGGNQ